MELLRIISYQVFASKCISRCSTIFPVNFLGFLLQLLFKMAPYFVVDLKSSKLVYVVTKQTISVRILEFVVDACLRYCCVFFLSVIVGNVLINKTRLIRCWYVVNCKLLSDSSLSVVHEARLMLIYGVLRGAGDLL